MGKLFGVKFRREYKIAFIKLIIVSFKFDFKFKVKFQNEHINTELAGYQKS